MEDLTDICKRFRALHRPSPDREPDTDAALVTVQLAGQRIAVHRWAGETLPDQCLAIDTETDMIQDHEVPRLRLASVAGDRGSCYLVHPDQLGGFISTHQTRHFVAHKAAFDFWVIANHLADTGNRVWWDIAADGRLHCTMLLDELLRIAQTDEPPKHRNLAAVAKQCAGLELDKADPYRTRFAELPDDWHADPGFFRYAALDALATIRTFLEQARQAAALSSPYTPQLLPGAVRQFGLLTVSVQVRGHIALAAIERAGIQVDLPAALQAQEAVWGELDGLSDRLDHQAREFGVSALFKIAKRSGSRKQTPAGVPQRSQDATRQALEHIAQQHGLDVPQTTRGSSDSASFWSQHRHLHPFVDTYCTWQEQAKLAQFFAGLQSTRIHPQYVPLVRTGRTSCRNPNLQQLPRSDAVRQIITAAPGHKLLCADYSTLELRTLAQVCLRRYGRSVLAELYQGDPDTDLHSYTAARLAGLTDEQFRQLPTDQRKTARQQAKAVNFGVPGGLGAASLASYAKSTYGVDMPLEQAKDFRGRLCEEVYPELGQYLAGSYGSQPVPACTLTGRIRANCGFTQARNTPFQGLAADGAKLALFELVRAGYQLVGFVHDEVLIELPADSDTDHAAHQVQQIMQRTMQVCTPDIPIRTAAAVSNHWQH